MDGNRAETTSEGFLAYGTAPIEEHLPEEEEEEEEQEEQEADEVDLYYGEGEEVGGGETLELAADEESESEGEREKEGGGERRVSMGSKRRRARAIEGIREEEMERKLGYAEIEGVAGAYEREDDGENDEPQQGEEADEEIYRRHDDEDGEDDSEEEEAEEESAQPLRKAISFAGMRMRLDSIAEESDDEEDVRQILFNSSPAGLRRDIVGDRERGWASRSGENVRVPNLTYLSGDRPLERHRKPFDSKIKVNTRPRLEDKRSNPLMSIIKDSGRRKRSEEEKIEELKRSMEGRMRMSEQGEAVRGGERRQLVR